MFLSFGSFLISTRDNALTCIGVCYDLMRTAFVAHAHTVYDCTLDDYVWTMRYVSLQQMLHFIRTLCSQAYVFISTSCVQPSLHMRTQCRLPDTEAQCMQAERKPYVLKGLRPRLVRLSAHTFPALEKTTVDQHVSQPTWNPSVNVAAPSRKKP